MQYDLTNFLVSLASAMAALADDLVLGDTLFIHQMLSDDGTARAVLRIYGGPVPGELRPVPRVSVQCETIAADGAKGLTLAQSLYATLFDPDNSDRPRQTWSIPGKAIGPDSGGGATIDDPDLATWDVRLVIPMGPPGLLGRDDAGPKGRWRIPFNFDVIFSEP